jgi:ArsR family transcriptional regulator, arsenate/arsenite/antimonite-responsive transcriptional repressor
MKMSDAVDALASLAQETRLSIFRLLVKAGKEGLSAGVIAEKLGLPAATLSFHIAQLARCGLVSASPRSRFIYYSANYPAMDNLLAYLTDHCCEGKPCLPKTASVAGSKRRLPKAA